MVEIMSQTEENVNVDFKYSSTGTPYIEGPFGQIIFSKATKTKQGYKYLVLNHRYEQNFKHKGQNISTVVKESYIKKVDFTTSGQGDKKIPDYVMPKKVMAWFGKIFKSLCDEIENEIYFSESNIEILEGIINDTDFNKLYKKKKKRRKRIA